MSSLSPQSTRKPETPSPASRPNPKARSRSSSPSTKPPPACAASSASLCPRFRSSPHPSSRPRPPSLEALQAYSLGHAAHQHFDDEGAIAYFKKAVELDPNFAIAWAELGVASGNTGQTRQSQESIKKAFELKDRASEHEKLYISAHYYDEVTDEAPERSSRSTSSGSRPTRAKPCPGTTSRYATKAWVNTTSPSRTPPSPCALTRRTTTPTRIWPTPTWA